MTSSKGSERPGPGPVCAARLRWEPVGETDIVTAPDAPRQTFFGNRLPGEIGLAVFLNAGDPPLDALGEVLEMLDDSGVDCVELAVPFPNSPTDGPVIRRSAARALAAGVGLDLVLRFVSSVGPRLRRLRIALLADWGHTLKRLPMLDFTARVRQSGAHAVLVHGVPPRLRMGYFEAAQRVGLPVVTTCYPNSGADVLAEAATFASAYLYLCARYGRTGVMSDGYRELGGVLAALQARAAVPVAIGFGVSSRSEVDSLLQLGADAAIVGSAAVACVERTLSAAPPSRVVEELRSFVARLIPIPEVKR